jgi:hypothetical protein
MIGRLLAAVVTDPDSERRLKPYGLWASDRFDTIFRNIEAQLPAVTREQDTPGNSIFIRNALQYAYAKAMLNDAQWQTAEKLFLSYLPNASCLGEKVYKCLPVDTCDTALKARQAYQNILREIGLVEYYVVWNVIKNNQPFSVF